MKEVLSSLTTYHTKTKIFCWNKEIRGQTGEFPIFEVQKNREFTRLAPNFSRRPPPNSKTLLAVSSIGESGEWGRLRTARAAISLGRFQEPVCKNVVLSRRGEGSCVRLEIAYTSGNPRPHDPLENLAEHAAGGLLQDCRKFCGIYRVPGWRKICQDGLQYGSAPH